MNPITFAPDADPTSPGVIVSATNLIPTERGYRDAPQLENLTNEPIEDASFIPFNAVMLRDIDGDGRLFVGGNNALYERVYAGWAKRVTSVSAVTTLGWGLRQFGDVTLASNSSTTLQATSGPFFTTFATVTGGPVTHILCVTTTHQVMALATEGGDGWACSALGDHTDWTPALATQAATGRFLATPGPITGGIEFGPHILAFKERSMYWMRYANVPIIWATEVISNEVGAINNQVILDVGERVLFLGPDDFYSFDGTKPVSIGANVRRWFFDRIWWPFRYKAKGVYDAATGCAWWWYPIVGDATLALTQAIVYHVPSGRWGHAEVEVGAPLILRERIEGSQSPFLMDGGSYQHILGAFMDGDLHAVRDRTSTATVRMGWFGDDMMSPELTKIRPRFLTKPSNATATFYKTDTLDEETLVGTATLREGAFGTKQNAHWHSIEMTLNAPFELTHVANDLPRAGGKR